MHARPDRYARALSAGLRAGALWYATVTLVMAFLALGESLLPVNGLIGVLTPGIGSVMAVAAGLLMATRTRRSLRVAKIVGCFVVMEVGFVVYLVTLDLPPDLPHTTASFSLSLFKTALIAFAVTAGRRWGPTVVGLAVVVVTEAVCAVAGPRLGYPWAFDGAEISALIVVLLASVGFAVARLRAEASRRVVRSAEDEDALLRTRAIARSQAAAVVHDTVLNDLAVLATSEPGPLTRGLAQRLAATLEVLASPDWSSPPPADDAATGGAVGRAVRHATASGLRVRVSGSLAVLAALDPEVERALGGAVDQCLANVLLHAGTDTAEVTVLGEQDGVSVMVTDDGSGFDLDAVDPDRLGLATSVRARIAEIGGTVRVFAKPGLGTTVLLTVPRATAPLLGSGT